MMASRNLIALYITILLLPLTIISFRLVGNIDFKYEDVNDEIALSQLRENLLFIYDLNYSENELSFRYKGDEFYLSQINDKLILHPGSQIYLMSVDDLYFEDVDGYIYVNYERNNKRKRRILCPRQGLYLDDFSDCPIVTDESDTSEE